MMQNGEPSAKNPKTTPAVEGDQRINEFLTRQKCIPHLRWLEGKAVCHVRSKASTNAVVCEKHPEDWQASQCHVEYMKDSFYSRLFDVMQTVSTSLSAPTDRYARHGEQTQLTFVSTSGGLVVQYSMEGADKEFLTIETGRRWHNDAVTIERTQDGGLVVWGRDRELRVLEGLVDLCTERTDGVLRFERYPAGAHNPIEWKRKASFQLIAKKVPSILHTVSKTAPNEMMHFIPKR